MKKFVFLILFMIAAAPTFAQKKVETPKLVVGIVIDQMRYDYLYRFYDDFGKDGFKKLMAKGMNCKNTSYNYVPTFTGPGHASIYTGTTPKNHGIVANSWYSTEEGKMVNCVEDSSVNPLAGTVKFGKFSPNRLKSNTITDQLKLTYPKSKVYSFSLKNRGAILPGGHLSDGSFWFDYSNGNFISSTYFGTKLPSWVEKFNSDKVVDSYLNKTWNLLKDTASYSESRQDNYPYEETLPGKNSPTFPYEFNKMRLKSELPYDLFGLTPFSNTALFDLAKKGIIEEQLGQDDVPDMINISISATDIIGHAFGPFSREIQDTYLRLDQDLASFIKFLDKEVGKNNYVLFLTADHAVEPIPQYLIDKKLTGNYFDMEQFEYRISNELFSISGAIDESQTGLLAIKNEQIYLDWEALLNGTKDKKQIKEELKSRMMQMEGIKNVFLKEELIDGKMRDKFTDLIAKGIHPKESGDIIFMLEPGYLPVKDGSEESKKGTSHGSPYGYDTNIPLIWYGGKTPTKCILDPVEITDITPTLTQILNLQKPNGCTGEVIIEYFSK